MKKNIISLLIAMLAVCLLAGCVAESQEPASDNGAAQVETTPAPADNSGDKDVSSQLTGLDECLDYIRETVQPGSAGGSLKSASAAAKLMDWGVACKLDSDQIAAQVDNYTVNLNGDEKEEFEIQLESVKGMYQELLTEGQEGILSDAGAEDCGYPYGVDSIPAVEAVFNAAGIE